MQKVISKKKLKVVRNLKFFAALELRLQQRRPRQVLADQGIIPRKSFYCHFDITSSFNW